MKLLFNSLKSMFRFLKSLVVWVIQFPLNRKNWKTIRQYLAMAETLSRFAKKEKAAKNIGWLAKKFDKLTKNYSDQDTKRAATEISSARGILDDLTIGYTEGKVTGNVGPIEAIYNPKNGEVKFGLKL